MIVARCIELRSTDFHAHLITPGRRFSENTGFAWPARISVSSSLKAKRCASRWSVLRPAEARARGSGYATVPLLPFPMTSRAVYEATFWAKVSVAMEHLGL